MAPVEPGIPEHQLADSEIEDSRRELEAKLARERVITKETQKKALLRIEKLSEDTISQVSAEWEKYEETIVSLKEEYLERSRNEMNRLMRSCYDSRSGEDTKDYVLKMILPFKDDGTEDGNNS